MYLSLDSTMTAAVTPSKHLPWQPKHTARYRHRWTVYPSNRLPFTPLKVITGYIFTFFVFVVAESSYDVNLGPD